MLLPTKQLLRVLWIDERIMCRRKSTLWSHCRSCNLFIGLNSQWTDTSPLAAAKMQGDPNDQGTHWACPLSQQKYFNHYVLEKKDLAKMRLMQGLRGEVAKDGAGLIADMARAGIHVPYWTMVFLHTPRYGHIWISISETPLWISGSLLFDGDEPVLPSHQFLSLWKAMSFDDKVLSSL